MFAAVKAAFLTAGVLAGLLVCGVGRAASPSSEPAHHGADDSTEQAKAPAEADAKAPERQADPAPEEDRFGHARQFGLRVGLTGGYRVIFRYDKSPFCRTPDPLKVDKDQQKFCGGGAPLALDLALSFGVLDFIEPYAWARFGLAGESATNTTALKAFGVGARIYTMSDSRFKIFVDPAVGMEVEGGGSNPAWRFRDGTLPDYKTDFLFHLGVGPQYDFARQVGVYLNAGLTTGVLRYIHTELELSGGVQVRVP
jgi:hypothetical protein